MSKKWSGIIFGGPLFLIGTSFFNAGFGGQGALPVYDLIEVLPESSTFYIKYTKIAINISETKQNHLSNKTFVFYNRPNKEKVKQIWRK